MLSIRYRAAPRAFVTCLWSHEMFTDAHRDAHLVQVLVTPVLECLHSHAQEWYDEWTPSELQVDHFRGFQFEQVGSSLRSQPCSGFLEPEDPATGASQSGAVGPPKLVAIAAAVLWSKPDMQRAGDLMELSVHNQNLSDVLLSVNKLGYGMLACSSSLACAVSVLVVYLSVRVAC